MKNYFLIKGATIEVAMSSANALKSNATLLYKQAAKFRSMGDQRQHSLARKASECAVRSAMYADAARLLRIAQGCR